MSLQSGKEYFTYEIIEILQIYIKLKDLAIHNMRNLMKYSRGKWSKHSFYRLVETNIDVLTDVFNTGKLCKCEYFNVILTMTFSMYFRFH